MKVKDLLEMPELRNWTKDQDEWIKNRETFISFRTAERLYIAIGSLAERFDQPVFIFLNKKRICCSAFVKSPRPPSGELGLREISHISFYYPKPTSSLPLDIINPLQVSKVWTDQDFEGRGLASFMYASLVREGFTIVSDRIQYLGGKELWKKMAREAGLLDYSVKVWSEDDGYVGEYDGSNIDDADIWKPTIIGQRTLLILSGK